MTLRLPTASRVFPGSLPQGFSCLSLLLLQGRDFPFDDCGRAFTCLPVENPRAPVEATVCNLDCLLDTMSYRVRPAAPSGPCPSVTAPPALICVAQTGCQEEQFGVLRVS